MANVSLKIGKHKSRTGGLTKAGREKYNRATGANLKAPQPGRSSEKIILRPYVRGKRTNEKTKRQAYS